MKNKLKYINTLEQKINYNFNNKDMLEEALSHSSFKNKSNLIVFILKIIGPIYKQNKANLSVIFSLTISKQ